MATTTTTKQRDSLQDAGQQAGQEAGHLAERTAEVGLHQADRAREQAAEGLHQLAESARRVSGDMDADQQMIANLTSTAADQAERVAGFLRETDARQMVSTVEDLARRQPLLFVGGAFLLGIAASRFLKAAGGGSTDGRDMPRATGDGGTYATGYVGGGAYSATGPGSTERDPLTGQTSEGLRP